MNITTLEEFYKETSGLIPEGINKEIGHFNVFNIADMMALVKDKAVMPYNRRAYYKISLIRGRNVAKSCPTSGKRTSGCSISPRSSACQSKR